MKKTTILSKIWSHFKLITKHKYYVFQNCIIAHIPIQGILHDLSKYSFIEFCESVKFYSGTKSPIEECKMKNGYSKAWLHHKGINKHHYEYWQDNFDRGGTHLQMPYKYAIELICDYIAAGKAYMKDEFTYEEEYKWWKIKNQIDLAMYSQTKLFVELMLKEMKRKESNYCLTPKISKLIFIKSCDNTNSPIIWK